MHLVNQGQLAAALILAGVSLPAEFNLEEAVIARKEEEQRRIHPKLDKVALDLLAQVAAAKDLAAELAVKKQEFEANLPPGAAPQDIASYKEAHAAKTQAVLGEIAALKKNEVVIKAHAAAEAAVLKKHGLMRDKDGALVPFVESEKGDSGDDIAAAVSEAPPVPEGTESKVEPEAKPEEKKEPEPDTEKKESIN